MRVLLLLEYFGPGFVFNGRVLGELAVSRAIGDSDLKTRGKFLISTPEIVSTSIDLGTDNDVFTIRASRSSRVS